MLEWCCRLRCDELCGTINNRQPEGKEKDRGLSACGVAAVASAVLVGCPRRRFLAQSSTRPLHACCPSATDLSSSIAKDAPLCGSFPP